MDYKALDKEYLMNTYARYDAVLASGSGATAVTEDGKRLIDFGSGIGVNSLGYCNDIWTQAVSEQARTLQHTSNLYYNKPCIKLALELCECTGYAKVFFGNSGAEANECAIKLARKYSFDKDGKGRDTVVSLVNSFHGRTIATLSATGQDVFHDYFFPFVGSHEYIVANDIHAITKIDKRKTCAVMIELIQGEGGVVALDKEYVLRLEEYCLDNDILLIADEVQTGFGRTGKILTSELFDIHPDITTLAKGLGGGLPIGACLCCDKCAETLSYGNHGTTFGGNPVVCAGALAVLNTVNTPDFLHGVDEKAKFLRDELSKIKEVASVSGLGLMIGIALKTKKAKVVLNDCLTSGLMVLTAKDKIRLLPPLNISYEELSQGMDILKQVLNKEN